MMLLSVRKITDFLKIKIQVQLETVLKEIQLLVQSTCLGVAKLRMWMGWKGAHY